MYYPDSRPCRKEARLTPLGVCIRRLEVHDFRSGKSLAGDGRGSEKDAIVERLEAITAKTIIHHLQQSRLGKTDFVYSIPSTLT